MNKDWEEKDNTRHEMKISRHKHLADECGNCGSKEGLQTHHIVPVSLGGTNNKGNVGTFCFECHGKIHDIKMINLQKNTHFKKDTIPRGRTPFGYRRWKGKLYRAYGYKLIRSIIELRILHKVGIKYLVDGLNELGIESQYGKKWSHSQILYRILDCEAYFHGSHVEGPVMENSSVTWDMVVKHNQMGKGEKRMEYINKDVEFVKKFLKDNT